MHRLVVALGASFLLLFSGAATAGPEQDFWRWFQQNDALLFDFERNQEATFDALATALHKVDPQLTFEFGPKQNGRREFVISADGMRAAFPKVEALAGAAPLMPKWIVVKFRPRREPFDLRYKGLDVAVDTVTVALRPQGAKVGITVFIPGYARARHDDFSGIAFLFLDQALGEYDVETKVGSIDVAAPVAGEGQAISLAKLPAAFAALTARH